MQLRNVLGSGLLCAAAAALLVACASPEETSPRFVPPEDNEHLYTVPSGPCEPGAESDCLQFSCTGKRVCTSEHVWGACETGASTEECDGIDNDCDGIIDNPAGGCGQKTCETGEKQACATATCTGERTCTEGGVWGTCQTNSSTEVCDGVDNDCDGAVDNPASGSCSKPTCTTGETRSCNRYSCSGTDTCVGGNWAGVCSVQSTAEVCDGIDNDCDGVVDDNIAPAVCSGACGAGTTSCVNGASVCSSTKQPTTEVCDGLDNDCDGTVDNIASKGCSTSCGSGSAYCSNGAELCSARQPSTEVCDGIDNDCDGTNNEGVTNACGACGAVPSEVPNGADDNCNGQVDEGFGLNPILINWADLQAHHFGCDNAWSPWWQCQQVSDTICKNRGYLGGFGPVDWAEGGTTTAWIECVGQGHGATIAHVNPAGMGVSFGDSQLRKGEKTAREWCAGNGYPLAVGTIRWYGDGTVDIMCLPQSFGGYSENSAQQALVDRGCSDFNAFWATPVCSRAGHRLCVDVFGNNGIPLWAFGVVGLECLQTW